MAQTQHVIKGKGLVHETPAGQIVPKVGRHPLKNQHHLQCIKCAAQNIYIPFKYVYMHVRFLTKDSPERS